MSVPTFGVTRAAVIDRLPIDSTEVNADTELTPDDVDEYILDAGATFAGLLRQAGLDLDSLDAVTLRQAGTYVFAAAVADCLDQLAISGVPGFERYRNTADRIHDKYAARPETLNQRVTKARYSGDTTKTLRRDFTGRNYEF